MLETMTVRLVQSLRRNGGRIAKCPVIAVTPRLGAPLARSTKAAFRVLEVQRLSVRRLSRWTWYHLMNKPVALAAAEEIAGTGLIAFLDSDTVVLDEPSELILDDATDFAACAPDDGVVGTTGPDCPHEPHWRDICELLDLNIDELPWLTTCVGPKRIRLYWNSGVFSYRSKTQLAHRYLNVCETLLRNNAGFPANGEHWLEQVSLGLAMTKAGLRWKELSHSHNYAVGSFLPPPWKLALDHVRILHYHDAMSSALWSQLLQSFGNARPAVRQWLDSIGYLQSAASPISRIVSEMLRIERGVWRKRYRARLHSRCGQLAPQAQASA